jgi:hypothetical protein
MPTPTYDLISSTTLAAATSEVVFGSLPQTYRDLVVVFNGNITTASSTLGAYRFNSDTGSNYTGVNVSNASSGTRATTSSDFYYQGGAGISTAIIQVMDYSATDKHKTVLVRSGNLADFVQMYANRWANTAAITSMTLLPIDATSFAPTSTWAAGTTFALYGIAS